MSRTTKWEHSTDGWNIWRRIERTSRPAGRLIKVVNFEIDAEDDDEQCS